MVKVDRTSIIDQLKDRRERGEPILGGGAGNGASAKAQEDGGIDLLVIYNSGRFRMAGRGSLAGLMPYGNANEIVLEMAPEVVTAATRTPVLGGVCGTDPFLQHKRLFSRLLAAGLVGVQNFPTVGLIDGSFRANLEETGMGFDKEVELIRRAHEFGFVTTPYVFSEVDASAMAEAGADIVVCHFGLTTGGTIGAETARTLEDCAVLAERWSAAARAVNPDVITLVHGGPVATPADAARMATVKGVDGFYGASSMERLPLEGAIASNVRGFRAAFTSAVV
ncbi:phosphoenolpyruvate hydrolase family protein [Rhodococcus sp. NPDC059968]|uniref:phosphoenolpyruvate hydrolase family protein n=1 Tax=Rhodococcus sp. NPDC059968 TaxID=3347017 RepID=UPI00366B377A